MRHIHLTLQIIILSTCLSLNDDSLRAAPQEAAPQQVTPADTAPQGTPPHGTPPQGRRDLNNPLAAAQQFETDLGKIRDVLAKHASPKDAQVIRNTAIHVAPDLILSHSAGSAITPANGREVVVALSLAYELGLASETQYLSHLYNIPDLMVNYARHYHDSYLYSGRKLMSVADFIFLNQEGRNKLAQRDVQNALAAWFEYGLAFALAHELGHQAQNAIYLATDTDADKRQKETLADEWAAQAMLDAGYSPIHGIMLVTYLLDAEEAVLPGTYQGDHPFMADRALHLLGKFSTQQHKLYATARYANVPLKVYLAMETEWKKELTAMSQRRAARTLSKLESDSGAGNLDATDTLATEYLYGIGVGTDLQTAAKYLERAALAGDFWAQMNLGVMYAKGSLGTPDLARARLWLGLADEVGNRMAAVNLNIISKNVSDSAAANPAATIQWCQGKCVFDDVRASLDSCKIDMRARCVDSCVNKYHHTKSECEDRFCNNMSDEQRYFDRCYLSPSANAWQQCLTTCDPSAPPSTVKRASVKSDALPSPFEVVVRQVTDTIPQRFKAILTTTEPRDPGDSATVYHVGLAIPDLKDCKVLIDDDPKRSATYMCDRYRGRDQKVAIRAYRDLVGEINGALARIDGAQVPCIESQKHEAGRVTSDISQCRSTLSGGGEIRVRITHTTFAATSTELSLVDVWIDTP